MRFNFLNKLMRLKRNPSIELPFTTNADKALAMASIVNRESPDDKREIIYCLVRHALPTHHLRANPTKRGVQHG